MVFSPIWSILAGQNRLPYIRNALYVIVLVRFVDVICIRSVPGVVSALPVEREAVVHVVTVSALRLLVAAAGGSATYNVCATAIL